MTVLPTLVALRLANLSLAAVLGALSLEAASCERQSASASPGRWCAGDAQCIYDGGFRHVSAPGSILARDAVPEDPLGILEVT